MSIEHVCTSPDLSVGIMSQTAHEKFRTLCCQIEDIRVFYDLSVDYHKTAHISMHTKQAQTRGRGGCTQRINVSRVFVWYQKAAHQSVHTGNTAQLKTMHLPCCHGRDLSQHTLNTSTRFSFCFIPRIRRETHVSHLSFHAGNSPFCGSPRFLLLVGYLLCTAITQGWLHGRVATRLGYIAHYIRVR